SSLTPPPAATTPTLQLTDWLIGATLCLRRAALSCLASPPFASHYFLYFEDADLCRRLREADWDVALVPEAQAMHEAQQSSGSSPASKRATLIHFFRSFLHYA